MHAAAGVRHPVINAITVRLDSVSSPFFVPKLEVLRLLAQHRGEIVSRDRLLEEVWGYESYPTTRTVDNHILRLRQKLEPDSANPRFFLTIHGAGYKFIPGNAAGNGKA